MAFRAAPLSSGGIVPRVTIGRVTPFNPRERPNADTRYCRLFKATTAYISIALMRVLHWLRCWAEEPGYATGNPPGNYGQIRGGCSGPWMIAVDQRLRTMPYTAFNKQIRSLMTLPGWGRKVLLLAIIPVPPYVRVEGAGVWQGHGWGCGYASPY